jgi:hypothetical protein
VLIDDRVPPFRAPDEGPVWEPDPTTAAWGAAAVGLGVGGALAPGIVGFGLLCGAIGCGAHAISRALPYGDGLREYRQ